MRLLKSLYFQVLLGIAAGVLFGYFYPEQGMKMKPLGEAFIKAVKMLIAPIIFSTVVSGIAKMGDLKKLGWVGVKALGYFLVVTTLSLAIGMAVAHVVKPGAGLDPKGKTSEKSAAELANYEKKAETVDALTFFTHIIPESFGGPFAPPPEEPGKSRPGAGTEILQVLFLAILCGIVMAHLGPKVEMVNKFVHQFGEVLFGVVGIIVRAAPLAAFGAMAFTVGQYGLKMLASLGLLLACVYITCLLFVFVVLGSIARLHGFSIWRMLVWIREEIFLVLGTSSSETALPGLMRKLERAGCADTVVGVVVPAGYSFNLDGTSIYLSLAAIFIAQVTQTPLSFAQEMGIMGLLLLTSKGAAAVTGGGFITLTATLKATPIPVSGLELILGIDRFMSEARAITNLIGNAVATVVVSKWERQFDEVKGAVLKPGAASLPPAVLTEE